MKIRISNTVEHPLDFCIPELQELVDDIQVQKEKIYSLSYAELENIYFTLDNTPEEDIPSFNEKYAYVQSHINRISSISIAIKRELKIWNEFKSRAKILYRRAKNNLLINNTSIKALRNKEMQEAAIQEQIPSLVTLLESLDIIIDSLESDDTVVRIKKEQLDTANVNLNRQQKVVEDMIGLNMLPTGLGALKYKKNNS